MPIFELTNEEERSAAAAINRQWRDKMQQEVSVAASTLSAIAEEAGKSLGEPAEEELSDLERCARVVLEVANTRAKLIIDTANMLADHLRKADSMQKIQLEAVHKMHASAMTYTDGK
jgi:sugar phosphate isomerase/epimerase